MSHDTPNLGTPAATLIDELNRLGLDQAGFDDNTKKDQATKTKPLPGDEVPPGARIAWVTLPLGESFPKGLTQITIGGKPFGIPDHHTVIASETYPIGPQGENTVTVWVRRCDHGSYLIHSKEVGGANDNKDRLQVVEAPNVDAARLSAAIGDVLPEIFEQNRWEAILRLAKKALAAPQPEKKERPKGDLPEGLKKALGELLVGLFARPPKPLTVNPIVESPNEQGLLTVPMSQRGPVVIDLQEWPLLGEEFEGLEGWAVVVLRMRRHADGRLLIYGENRLLSGPTSSLHGGYLLENETLLPDSRAPRSRLSQLIREITGTDPAESLNEAMLLRLLAKLPAQRL